MPDNWKDYRDWKELMEDIRRRPREEDYPVDDEVEDLKELFKEYID